MRLFVGWPRVFGVRTGMILGPEDFAPRGGGAPRAESGFVYVIRGDHGLVKVGFSTNPEARLATLRTASPFPLAFAYVCAVEGGAGPALAVEQQALAHLAGRRMNGEWFDTNVPTAVAAIAMAASWLGHRIVEIPADRLGEVMRLAAQGPAAAPSVSPLRRALQIALGLTLGFVTTSAILIAKAVAYR
ncbi:hypothetical protein GCM10007036_14490 [Alsobacter metallidurans]|uniref:Bacteriophage T5 Orf172 DNA-binding domain-containing protein n=1 Tax=Alsobacter metallidurans TaxID=340221 RepID=A0A917I5M5_9HYPH|nr:GIY-YIG nuclease family protein [Alsobacter metallidurans]GGH14888.1 hypothetical protein GCM10007036_14490 [Alsobacter metallidurans]